MPKDHGCLSALLDPGWVSEALTDYSAYGCAIPCGQTVFFGFQWRHSLLRVVLPFPFLGVVGALVMPGLMAAVGL